MAEKPEVTTAETQPLRESAMVGAPYEGASRINRETALWSPSVRSADDDIKVDKVLLDARGRDLVRNDGYIAGAVATHKDSIVGSFFLLNAAPNLRVLKGVSRGFDESWSEEFQSEVEAKFGLWAESPDNWPDASRHNTLTGLVRLAVGVYTVAGEVLATAEWLRDGTRPYRTALQMVDLDRLSNPRGMDDTMYLRQGVERDRFGAPLAYHIRMTHPFSTYVGMDSFSWKRVPARKPWGRIQVIHILEQMRPDQTRGVAEMVSALKEMKMTKKFREIVLQNAVVNATYAAAIESELPPAEAYAQIGGEAGMPDYIQTYLSGLSDYVGSARNLHIDGVKIPHLYPGTKLKLLNAGQPGGVGTVFEESLLRNIAASTGLSYEQLARDYSKSNYSSARASMLETWKGMQARKKMVADRFASHVYALWLEEAIARGDVPLPSGVTRDFFYEGQNKDAVCAATWIGANRGQIDELKETQAAVMRIRSGLSTYEDEMSKMGKDYRQVFAQAAKEKRLMAEMGLEFNADPSKSAGLGGQGVKDDKKPGSDVGRLGPGSGNAPQETGEEDEEDPADDADE
jgi:lambda family phage portal protein